MEFPLPLSLPLALALALPPPQNRFLGGQSCQYTFPCSPISHKGKKIVDTKDKGVGGILDHSGYGYWEGKGPEGGIMFRYSFFGSC